MSKKLFVSGSFGTLGKELIKKISQEKKYLILNPSKEELDLTDRKKIFSYFEKERPDFVIHLASIVGSIEENIEEPVKFLQENLKININIIEASSEFNVERLINISSACIFPKIENREIKEIDILESKIEKENEAYALSKIIGVKLCEYYNKEFNKNFITLVPTNFYGNENGKHVINSILEKIKNSHLNKNVIEIWGSGNAKRDFIHIKNLSNIICKSLEVDFNGEHLINIPGDNEIKISELAELCVKVSNLNIKINYLPDKPEGTLRRKLNGTKFEKFFEYNPENINFENEIEKIWEKIMNDN